MPVEPPTTDWDLGEIPSDADDLVAVGADLEPGTILRAYRSGLFPMHVQLADGRYLGWWSPDPRGIIPLDGLRMTRSWRRSCRRYTTTVDEAFDVVIEACADPSRAQGWIDDEIVAAYRRLHDLGWVHSLEAWDDDGELVGGLYGVAVGGLFAGESMFTMRRDGSKVALASLVDRLGAGGGVMLDVQWATDHLASLGAVEIPRREYLRRVADAVARPQLDLGRV